MLMVVGNLMERVSVRLFGMFIEVKIGWFVKDI